MPSDRTLVLNECAEFHQTLISKPPAILHCTVLLLLVLLTVAGAWASLTEANLIVKAHGRIRPTTQPTHVFNSASGENFGAATGGRAVKVNYRQGDSVRKGDLLIQLDTEQLEIAIAKQTQTLQNVEAQSQRLDKLARHFAQQGHDDKRVESQLRREVTQGQVDATRGDLKALELSRRHAAIIAPVSGLVTSVELKVGDVVQSGKPVVFIAEDESLCMKVSVSAEDVGHLRINMPARIKLDAYDYQKYGTVSGSVLFVSPDSETPTGSADKLRAFYTIKLRLNQTELRRGQLHGQIKLGMTGQAEIITDRESILSILLRGVRRTISLD